MDFNIDFKIIEPITMNLNMDYKITKPITLDLICIFKSIKVCKPITPPKNNQNIC